MAGLIVLRVPPFTDTIVVPPTCAQAREEVHGRAQRFGTGRTPAASTNETAALQVTGDVRVTIEAPPALVGSAVIPGGAVFEGTTVGGLSGIAFNPLTGTYLAISDDRGTFGSPRILRARDRPQ